MKNIIKKLTKKSKDPEDVLQKNLRDLNENIPKMNSDISLLKSKITELNSELDMLKTEKTSFQEKKDLSQKTKQDSITKNLDESLKRIMESINTSEKDLHSIEKNYKKVMNARKNFIQKKEKKINKALSMIKENEREKWNEHCSKLMEGFGLEEDSSLSDGPNEYYNNKINESFEIIEFLKEKSTLICKKEVKENVDKIISLSEKVLDDLKDHPDHLRKARMFLSYYLDAAGKVVSGYTDLCNEEILSDHSKNLLLNAEKLLTTIQDSFENFLKKLHDMDAFKLDVELKVLEKTLKNSGL